MTSNASLGLLPSTMKTPLSEKVKVTGRLVDLGALVRTSNRLRSSLGRRAARGFTLIELMVVIVILGVLGTLVVPRLMSKPDEARVTAAKTNLASIMQALDMYRLDNQRYPTAEQGLAALAVRPTSAPVPNNWKQYLKEAPVDPWGRPYVFLNPGIKAEIDVMSYGADGQQGGEGVNADIGSWSLNR
jgi:general secretion pathway protein G